jgi:hypothetical protein
MNLQSCRIKQIKVRHHEKIIAGCIITAGILLAGSVQAKHIDKNIEAALVTM